MIDSNRRSFFFGITLSEIGFILFFALLLFAFFQQKKDKDEIDQTIREFELLEKKLETREKALAELEQLIRFKTEEERNAFINELVPRHELAQQNAALEDKAQELEEKIASFEKLQQAMEEIAGDEDDVKEELEDALALKQDLQKIMGENADMSTDDVREVIEEAVELKKEVEEMLGSESSLDPKDIQERLEDAIDLHKEVQAAREGDEKVDPEKVAEAMDAQEAIDQYNENSATPITNLEDLKAALQQALKAEDLENQIIHIMGKGGLDWPPCWPSPGGDSRPEYLFDVVIRDESLVFTSIAPPHRRNDYERLPNTGLITSSPIKLTELSELADPILQVSIANNCRHFVKITDQSNLAYKEATLAIGHFFYYYVNR